MSRMRYHQSALAGLLLFAWPLLSPAQTTPTTTPGLTVTSGMVGVSSTQTARLNVLNLQQVVAGVTAVACPATLAFYDDTGALLKQVAVTNISPATAGNLVFKPTVPSTAVNARAQLRAVVFTPFATITPTPTASGSTTLIPAGPVCTLLSSFEVMDDATGNTQSLTTDFRSMSPYFAQPVAALKQPLAIR